MHTYFWDIETSKIVTDQGTELQITYLSNVICMNYETGEICSSHFFRTIEETIFYFEQLGECTVWSHNLDYELTFLLRELGQVNALVKRDKQGEVIEDIYKNTSQNIILRDKHAPITITLECLPNITFRDSYCLFSKSVSKLGDEINLPKLEYDYNKVRTPWDKLTQEDYDYNERDNVIVAKSLFKYMQENKLKFKDIPLTFTSFVKKKRKEFIQENFDKKSLIKFYFDRNEQYNNFSFFELALNVFQGGLTASNILDTGKFIEKGVYSIDAKSMYPFQMVDKYFPFFSHKNVTHYHGDMANEFFKLGITKGYLGVFKFKNIRVKNRNYLLPISSSQMSKGYVSSDKVLFNGKLLSANELILPCNNIDIDTINLVYKYDEIECMEIVSTNKSRRLREEEVSFLLKAFLTKEKVIDKNDLEYILSKIYINAMYGVKVTSPIKSSYIIEDGEIKDNDYFDYGIEERKEIYETHKNNTPFYGGTLDIYTDGIFVTSFSRYKLVEMMKKLVDKGCNVVYSDTDSLKFYLNNVSEKDVFNFIIKENVKIIFNNRKNPRFKKFLDKFNLDNNDMELIDKLGIWEIETKDDKDNPKPLPLFVTYGAKKYGYINYKNEVFTTIAGCSKKNPPIVIKNVAKNEGISIQESFKFIMQVGTTFDHTASGRKTAKVEKTPREEMYHLTYKGKKINQFGGIILEDTTYTLGMTINDTKLINSELQEETIMSVNLKGEISYE